MKFIHTADLHLDSKLQSHLPPHLAKERQKELFDTFCRMVYYAISHGIKCIIIAGDLFDTKGNEQKRIRQQFVSVVKKAEGIEFYYVKGNHDNDNSLEGFENEIAGFHILGEDGTCVNPLGKSDVVLSADRTFEFPKNTFNVLCLHGEINTEINPKNLSENIDYLALGHIHSFKTGRLSDRGLWCYSGCLEGRGFDESGDKGFVIVDTEEFRKSRKISFVPFAKRRLHKMETELYGKENFQSVAEKLRNTVSSVKSTDMVEVTLNGKIAEDSVIDLEGLEQLLSQEFYFAKLKDKTLVQIDYEKYSHDFSLKGQFVRTVQNMKISESDKEKVIMTGLSYILGREV